MRNFLSFCPIFTKISNMIAVKDCDQSLPMLNSLFNDLSFGGLLYTLQRARLSTQKSVQERSDPRWFSPKRVLFSVKVAGSS